MKTHLATTLAAAVLSASAVALIPGGSALAADLPVQTRLVSRGPSHGPATSAVAPEVDISGNGRFVAFATAAALVPEDTNGTADVYVRDRWSSVAERVSLTETGSQIAGASSGPSLSDDGR